MARLITALVLLLASLLVVFKAPLHFTWLLAVVITNYPLVFAGLCLLLLVSAFWAKKYKAVVIIITFSALVLYSLPIIAALNENSYVSRDMGAAFGKPSLQTPKGKPFSISTMFTGIVHNTTAPVNMAYKKVDTTTLTLDFYPSSSGKKSPLVVVVHGGSWESGDNKQFLDFNSYLAGQGYAVAAINYRLAPAYRSPAPMEDTKDAIAYLSTNAAKYNIDTNNIILLGRSAGAQVALVAAYTAHNPNIKGVIDFYGPADMVWGGQVKTNSLMLDTRQIYLDYFGGIYQDVPQVFKANSACDYVNASTPPTLIIHATIDPMVSHIHSEHLSDKLTHYHVPHYFLSLPFATHGCDYNINGPGGQVTTYAVVQFLQAVTTQ